MGFLTVPSGEVLKGQSYEMSVDKTALALDPKVSGDAYFSNSANWYRFVVAYESSNDGQIESVVFDASLASPIGAFEMSSTAIGVFKILQFTILDFDGGSLELGRQDLTVADFALDIPLKIAPSQLVTEIVSQTEIRVLDAQHYSVGHKVTLFNVDTNSFEDVDEVKAITGITSNVIYLESAFTTTIVASKHRLRFPHSSKCNADQVANFYFNS